VLLEDPPRPLLRLELLRLLLERDELRPPRERLPELRLPRPLEEPDERPLPLLRLLAPALTSVDEPVSWSDEVEAADMSLPLFCSDCAD
jgi:hypothetical protein